MVITMQISKAARKYEKKDNCLLFLMKRKASQLWQGEIY